MKDLSIVIPLYNEEESLPELHDWIVKVMDEHKFSYEVWFIDDGSNDNSWQVVQNLAANNKNIKGVKFRRNYGKSAGLYVGFARAEANVVVTMDADLQDSPEEIPEMYRMIVEDGYDLVSGWKKKRYDPITKTLPTKLYNGVTRKMSGIKLHDFNCGLKAYKYDVIKTVEVYGEMHRYIPVIAKWNGFKKIGEKVVRHQARKYGESKFGLSRFINGPLDLLSIMFVSKFGKRPMHLFGTLGALMFVLGFCIGIYLSVEWLSYFVFEIGFFGEYYPMTKRPIFYFSLVFVVVGTQLFLAGFLAEMMSRNSPTRNKYKLDTVLE
jgi:glycosyltransferase involved in cell wall biosynthesis